MVDAIISIKPRHVDNILAGKKTVELRVRKMNLPIGSRLWVYTTLPVGKVKLSAEIAFIESLSPKDMWRKHGKDICIPKEEFDEYTKLRDVVVAVGLLNIRALDEEVCLETMRKCESGFQPPQFFLKLNPDRALYSVFYKQF
ncbi:MAG: ASCH domain-containing protein [Gammaproteobacteria bacterium]|nr:ASCH domain-containing protein [Gammaproteobacteria bacterium]MBU2157418.1 ASCH domain-containing protein [Gammaproteobacteria bacterium]MBU2254914.1 ASCH domain-containing protein [Gammaproteobacteria bacterium]